LGIKIKKNIAGVSPPSKENGKMELTSTGKSTVLAALDTATLSMAIIGTGEENLDTKTITAGDFAFSSSSNGMVLSASVIFDIPAGKVVLYVRLYNNPVPASGSPLDTGTLPGTTAERTFTYAGTYTLTGYTITAA
jgi:hypothetical protein